MKKMIALACLAFSFAVSAPAFAGAQQDKMKACNAEAKGMKGEERKAFMSKCLKKETPAPTATAPTKQQDKMKACNADAKAKKLMGEERKKFMSACLKG